MWISFGYIGGAILFSVIKKALRSRLSVKLFYFIRNVTLIAFVAIVIFLLSLGPLPQAPSIQLGAARQ